MRIALAQIITGRDLGSNLALLADYAGQAKAGDADLVVFPELCVSGYPPRDLLGSLPGATIAEMPRTRERSFCCGAGGARMWMEERLGTRINNNRTEEALRTLASSGGNGHDAIATGCPFCRVMLTDGLTEKQADGAAPETTEVLDVAQLLLEAVKRAD